MARSTSTGASADAAMALVDTGLRPGGIVRIVDAADGTELRQFEVPGEATVLYFDLASEELLIGTTAGELVSVDIGV